MGLLDNVERGIEKVVRGAFSTGSSGRVEPLELAIALRRELDERCFTVGQGRTLAPNVFTARLSDSDFKRAQEWGAPLAEELCDVVIKHARSQSYTLQGPVRVSFTRDSALKAGVLEVDSATEKAGTPAPSAHQAAPPTPRQVPARMQPVLDIDGQRYSLNAPAVVLGRSSEADILVDDTGVSRRHLEIRTENGVSRAIDLGSTNGSFVNGQRVQGEADLTDGSTIAMGRTRITFRLLPARSGGR
ncbi:FhaA domain-containing protein [Arthrobacter sp. NPDC097144]|uniref:FhaA domain-containing protein n=1 Tax=Arthrobacter sp. NPDC097144 TaxID=3363946 RepID=UPI0038123058